MEKGRGTRWENWEVCGFADAVTLRNLQWDVTGILSGALNKCPCKKEAQGGLTHGRRAEDQVTTEAGTGECGSRISNVPQEGL